MTSQKDIERIKEMHKRGLNFSQISKIMGTTRQNIHQLMTRPRKYLVQEVLESLYWETVDCDDDFDGFLHIVSTIDGREIRIELKKILELAQPPKDKGDLKGGV